MNEDFDFKDYMCKEKAKVLIMLSILVSLIAGWIAHPDTKEVHWTSYEGQATTTIQVQTISVLAEKKECDSKNGVFRYNEFDEKITCTKPSEIIFEYELTN